MRTFIVVVASMATAIALTLMLKNAGIVKFPLVENKNVPKATYPIDQEKGVYFKIEDGLMDILRKSPPKLGVFTIVSPIENGGWWVTYRFTFDGENGYYLTIKCDLFEEVDLIHLESNSEFMIQKKVGEPPTEQSGIMDVWVSNPLGNSTTMKRIIHTNITGPK